MQENKKLGAQFASIVWEKNQDDWILLSCAWIIDQMIVWLQEFNYSSVPEVWLSAVFICITAS